METIVEYLDLVTEPRDTKATVKAVRFAIASARARKVRAIKVRHGDDDRTLTLLPRELRKLKAASRLVCFVPGTHFSEDYPESLYLLDKIPSLFSDPDFGAGRKDLTFLLIF